MAFLLHGGLLLSLYFQVNLATSLFSPLNLISSNNLVRLNTTNRVVGGTNIPVGRYVPYQISLQYFTKQGVYQHFCGGSIVSAELILTAAHCCQGLNTKRMSVLAGIRSLSDNGGVRSNVTSYVIHPRYEKLKTSDIAVLHIDPPLPLNDVNIGVVPVSSKSYIHGGVRVTLTGWGLRLPVQFPFLPNELESINYPSVLQTMSYYTISNRQCRMRGLNEVTKTELCAHSIIFKGACSGDSGGPLVAMTDEGLQQVGIVSYGLIICGIFDVPDVYTRVSEFSDWIQEQKKNETSKSALN